MATAMSEAHPYLQKDLRMKLSGSDRKWAKMGKVTQSRDILWWRLKFIPQLKVILQKWPILILCQRSFQRSFQRSQVFTPESGAQNYYSSVVVAQSLARPSRNLMSVPAVAGSNPPQVRSILSITSGSMIIFEIKKYSVMCALRVSLSL